MTNAEFIIRTARLVFGRTGKLKKTFKFEIEIKLKFLRLLFFKRTIENYKKRAQCIINQYSNYVVRPLNRTVNFLKCSYKIKIILFNNLRFQDEWISDTGREYCRQWWYTRVVSSKLLQQKNRKSFGHQIIFFFISIFKTFHNIRLTNVGRKRIPLSLSCQAWISHKSSCSSLISVKSGAASTKSRICSVL